MWNQTLDDLQAMVDADMSSRPAELISTVKLVLALSLLLGHVRSGIPPMDDGRPLSPSPPRAGFTQEFSNHPTFGNVVNCTRLLQRCKERGGAIRDAVVATFVSRAHGVVIEEETCQPFGMVEQGSKEWNVAYLRGLQEVVVHNEYYPQQESGPGNGDIALSCSSTVFKLCILLDELVDLAILFHAHLAVRFVDGGEDTGLPARVLGLLFNEINLIMSSTIANNDVSLELLCQYYVNWIYMAHAADSFQQQWSPLVSPARSSSSSSSASNVNGSQHGKHGDAWVQRFEVTGEALFGKLLEIIPQKLLALLSSSVSIEWTPTNRAERPHEFMLDLLQYLKIAFGPDSATRLLPTVKYQTVLFKSCTTISTGMLEIICDAAIGQVNAVAFQHLLLDVEAVVAFARENPVEGLEECFIQLHQTVSLFLNGEIELYLDLNERAMKYPNVKATTVLLILRKYTPLGVASRLFSRAQAQSFTSIDTKLIQHAMKQLSQELGDI